MEKYYSLIFLQCDHAIVRGKGLMNMKAPNNMRSQFSFLINKIVIAQLSYSDTRLSSYAGV